MIPAFDYPTFIAQYPMYATAPTQAILTNLWNEVDAVGTPLIKILQPQFRDYYYYVVLAHLAELWQKGPLVNGVTTSANQDSAVVGLEVDKSNSLIWWNQTGWGAKIAQLIKSRGGFMFVYGGSNFNDIYN